MKATRAISTKRNRLALTDFQRLALRLRQRLAGFPFNVGFDLADDPLGFLVVSVNEQPARAFRNVAPDQQHEDAEEGADAEREPPSDVGREVRRVQQDKGAARSGG